MNKLPLVSIIMANWNGGEIYLNCLKSLMKLNYPNWELILVDNGSIDGTDKLIQKPEFRKIKHKLISNKKNLGFAVANNQGYKVSKGKYLMLLNNDTLVDPNFLNVLVGELETRGDIAVVQPKIRIMDNPKYLDNAGSFLTFTGFLEHWGFLKKDGKEFNSERFVFSTKGACMLIRKSLVDKIGLFDDDFESYFEETDFCWRVWLSGHKALYCPKTFIYHKVGFTSKKQNQLNVNYNSFKNRICSLLKNLGTARLVLIGSVHLLILLFLSLYYAFILKFNWSLIILKSIIWNLKNIRQTMLKRRKIQSKRILSDKDIFPIIFNKTDPADMFLHFLRSNKMLSGKHSV